MLSHDLNVTYISYIKFRFTEILNFSIDSAMNYYVLEQEQRVFLSGWKKIVFLHQTFPHLLSVLSLSISRKYTSNTLYFIEKVSLKQI